VRFPSSSSMTSFHMGGAPRLSLVAERRERQKFTDALPVKATAMNALTTCSGRDNHEREQEGAAGKIQHSWKRLLFLVTPIPWACVILRRIVSPLNVLLLAFSLSCSCAAAAPGTIGAQLGQRADGRLFVRGIPVGQGADKAGLELDDEILAIDGHPVREMSRDDVKRAVRGDVGSTMVLSISRGGMKRDVEVQRSPMLSDAPTGQKR
jgi:PDZ domain